MGKPPSTMTCTGGLSTQAGPEPGRAADERTRAGIAAWRMPVAEFDGDSAWLEIARLAWNLGKWIAQLSLPDEVVRWEWKRFRQAWVYLAAKVLRVSRQIRVRLAGSHRFARDLMRAHHVLQP